MLKTLTQQEKALGKAELSTLACPRRLKLTALTHLSCKLCSVIQHHFHFHPH